LEQILCDRPNVCLPVLFDSESSSQETATSVERLLRQIEEPAGSRRREEAGLNRGEEERREGRRKKLKNMKRGRKCIGKWKKE